MENKTQSLEEKFRGAGFENSIATTEKSLGIVSIEELTGVKPENGSAVFVNVNRATLSVTCENRDDFLHAFQMTEGVRGVVWNEESIRLIMNDRYTLVKYEPNIHPLARIFFEKSSMSGRKWEGTYEPVMFAKKDLLQFLKTLEVFGGSPDMVSAIKDMKIREARHESDSIDLDDEKEKSVSTVEETFQTNIPKKFTLRIPVTADYIGDFRFAATVEKPSDRYMRGSGGDRAERKMIVLRCENAEEILKDAIMSVLNHLPPEVPRLYGHMQITADQRRW